MKRSLLLCALSISAVSSLGHGQHSSTSAPQLRARNGPPAQAPDEQLLPVSSVVPVEAYDRKAYPQKYSTVYMPLSLAIGRVRTSEFTIPKRSEWYDVMLQFEKPLPLQQMRCMTGTTTGPLDERPCEKNDPILRADWTVWLDGRIVQWGSIPDGCGCIFTNKDLYKQIGFFPLEKGKTYVVQVHLTKDGTALNVANPHLIVIPHQDMW
jgi:hypothetical protein